MNSRLNEQKLFYQTYRINENLVQIHTSYNIK